MKDDKGLINDIKTAQTVNSNQVCELLVFDFYASKMKSGEKGPICHTCRHKKQISYNSASLQSDSMKV